MSVEIHPLHQELRSDESSDWAEAVEPLWAMRQSGIPTFEGFVVRVRELPLGAEDWKLLEQSRLELEEETRVARGGAERPLLLSARVICNDSREGEAVVDGIGATQSNALSVAEAYAEPRFGWDCARRFLHGYGVARGIAHSAFREIFASLKQSIRTRRMPDREVPAEALQQLTASYTRLVHGQGVVVPDDPDAQLTAAIEALSAESSGKPSRLAGVLVYRMPLTNLGVDGIAGVASTRHPSRGEKGVFGDYLRCAQLQDVLSPDSSSDQLTRRGAPPGREEQALQEQLPAVFGSLRALCERLEKLQQDMQDVGFSVEQGQVRILRSRSARRTPQAAVKVAVDLANESVIEQREALLQVDPASVEQLLHRRLPDPDELEGRGVWPLARGLAASAGAAVGRITFDPKQAVALSAAGQNVVLVRPEATADDLQAIRASQAILTTSGGLTSHAAVVARGLGKCAVVGCSTIDIDLERQHMHVRLISPRDGASSVTLSSGDLIAVDGARGYVYRGELELTAAPTVSELEQLMQWADAHRRMRVLANADNAVTARTAMAYGAEGVGLCRTEHMFFAEDRLEAVRAMVLSATPEESQRWLGAIAPMQRHDFVELLTAMEGRPVTIRLLDWPLHEFLPRDDAQFEQLARRLQVSVPELRRRAEALRETDPMLGLRGVRVGIVRPEIYQTQVRAALEAAVECGKRNIPCDLRIMVPLVALPEEFRRVVDLAWATAADVAAQHGTPIQYRIGPMIELPRACLTADQLAPLSAFMSFGTNDLTQATLGMTRDEGGHFLPTYLDSSNPLVLRDPFCEIDVGVEKLIAVAVQAARKIRTDLELGLCGEHSWRESSVQLAERLRLDHISCPPMKVPGVRLAAARAALLREEQD